MANFNKKTAVVLFNLGGPDKLEAVKPFLFRLFNDKAIINLPQPLRFLLAKFISGRREKKAQEIYKKIGGKSPIYELTALQAHELEKELSFFGEFKVFIAMRYSKPFAEAALEEVIKYQPENLILLPLYPQFSSSTSGSSIEEFGNLITKNIKRFEQEVAMKIICCYPEEPEFIKSHAILIKQTLMQNANQKITDFRLLFSAHGLPQKIINKGDPYVFQIKKTTDKIMTLLSEILPKIEEEIDFHICYQSKVGPLEWTSPSLEHELKRAAIDKKIPVIIPISFVSDHSETLVELDIDYKNLAKDLGIPLYLRVPALNVESHFIKSLANICKTTANNQEALFFSGTQNIRICPKSSKLCINPNSCQS
jgi:ferrochelatase